MPAQTKRTSWSRPVDLSQALSGNPPPAPQVGTWLDGNQKRALFYPNEVHSVFGDPESMKSWLLLLAAVDEVKLGHHVLFVDMEANDRSIVDRLVLLGASKSGIRRQFHYFRPDDRINDADQTRFRLLVKKHRPTLVVLDGVTEAFSMHGLSINSAEDAAAWFRAFPRQFQVKPGVDYDGPAIVELDHVVKNHEARNGWALGTIHKKAGLKGAAYQVVARTPFGNGKHGVSRLFLEKDSPGGVEWVPFGKNRQRYVGDLHCDATSGDGIDAWIESPDEQAVVGGSVDVPLTQTHEFRLLMQRVCAFIKDHPDCSLRIVRGGVAGTNERIALAVEQLVAEGYVTNEGSATRRRFVADKEFSALRVLPGGGKS